MKSSLIFLEKIRFVVTETHDCECTDESKLLGFGENGLSRIPFEDERNLPKISVTEVKLLSYKRWERQKPQVTQRNHLQIQYENLPKEKFGNFVVSGF